MSKKVRVMLVDDSALVLNILNRIINADSRLEVVATTTSGREALSILDEIKPDVVCTDLHMPGISGLELIKLIMERRPTPILVVSISVHQNQTENIFNLLEAGAIDVFAKPRASVRLEPAEAKAFCDRILVVSRVHVFKSYVKKSQRAPTASFPKAVTQGRVDTVLIAGSTGAPQIYHSIFSQLKLGFCKPVIAVQHISEGFTQSFVDWLDRSTPNRVKVAEQHEILHSGTIYFPPDGTHIAIKEGRIILDSESPLDCGSRPSANVLFNSFADAGYSERTVAVLLSGMGRDGANGMAALHTKGAFTIAQSEQSCAIFGMPREAIRLGAVDQVLPPHEIVKFLNELC